jgi:hypothetical protein
MRTGYLLVATDSLLSRNVYRIIGTDFGELLWLLAVPRLIRMQPQRDVGWLHRLPYHPYQVVA